MVSTIMKFVMGKGAVVNFAIDSAGAAFQEPALNVLWRAHFMLEHTRSSH